MASNRKKSCKWARLIIWDKVKVPPCRYRVMHRKRVTCELHDSYFCSMTITHAIPKMAEVTHPDCQISEEIAEEWRHVHISVWEFEGNIRPTNWTEDSEKIPRFTKADLVVTLCALSRLSSTYIEEFKPHRRMILIPLLTAPTSHKHPSRKYILLYIYIPCCRLFDQRAEHNMRRASHVKFTDECMMFMEKYDFVF